MKRLLPGLVLCMMISACTPITFLAGATTGVVAYDRRAFSVRIKDHNISQLASEKINAINNQYPQAFITADVYNQVVLLTGQAPQKQVKKLATTRIQAINDVRAIYNQIQIAQPVSASQKAYDTWLATKAKTLLLTHNGLAASTQIKVAAQNNTIYLMGKVSHQEGHDAAETVSNIKGVHKVVKLFEYMS